MQKFRAKQAVLVVMKTALKVKEIVLNLTCNSNFIFNTKNNAFQQYDHSNCNYLWKMSFMDEGEAVLEHLRQWLKTENNDQQLWQHKNILSVALLSLLLNLFNSTSCSLNLVYFWTFWRSPNSHFEYFESSLASRVLLILKP